MHLSKILVTLLLLRLPVLLQAQVEYAAPDSVLPEIVIDSIQVETAFPSYLETGDIYLKKIADTILKKNFVRAASTAKTESKFIQCGLIQVRLISWLNQKKKAPFFSAYKDYAAVNSELGYMIDPSVQKRLEKNWHIRDSMIWILADLEFGRPENAHRKTKEARVHFLLMQFAGFIQSWAIYTDAVRMQTTKEQQKRWNDANLLYTYFMDELEKYADVNEKIKGLCSAPRIVPAPFKPKTTNIFVTDEEKKLTTIITTGTNETNTEGKDRYPTREQVNSAYETLKNYLRILAE